MLHIFYDTMRKVGSLLLIVLILLTSINYIAFSTQAGVLTTVTAVSEPLTEINVEPGSVGVGTIKVNVTCENYNTLTPLIISLFASSEVGSTTIDKPQLTFQGSQQSDEVMISIQVPVITTSASDGYSGTISGVWQQGGTQGSVNGDSFKIIVLPFYMCTIFSEEPVKELTQGDETTFSMRVENTGNCEDVYRLDILNSDQLKENKVIIDPIGKISLDEDGIQKFDVNVATSKETPVRVFSIHFRIVSECSEEEDEDPYSVEYFLMLRIHRRDEGMEAYFNPLTLIIIIGIIISGILVYAKKRKGVNYSDL
jgi:hypothetical protein